MTGYLALGINIVSIMLYFLTKHLLRKNLKNDRNVQEGLKDEQKKQKMRFVEKNPIYNAIGFIIFLVLFSQFGKSSIDIMYYTVPSLATGIISTFVIRFIRIKSLARKFVS